MNPEGLLNKIITGDEMLCGNCLNNIRKDCIMWLITIYKQRNRLRRLCWMYLRLFGRKGNL